MKTTKSFINSLAAFSCNMLAIVIGLVSQAVFIKILGEEYLGINGLFNNIISMLALAELGIGSAITYNLYKPLAENDVSKVKSLMNFYKKCYRIIAGIVFVIGILLIPFLPFFISKLTIALSIEIIYILFIIDLVSSYLLSYKRNLLYADQKNYIINVVHIAYLILLNVLQLSFLALTKNYYLFLIIRIFMRVLENIVISCIANKLYPYLKDKNVDKLDDFVRNDIYTKVKALIFHKVGSFVVTGTDNIIISKFLGVATVGLYSNYFLIINSVSVLFSQIFTSITASVGHLLVEKNTAKNFSVFQRLRFINFWISSFASICVLIIMESFITIWIGSQYLLSEFVLWVLVLNLYQTLMRYSFSVFKEAAGIYYEDRFVPVLESILNIVFSIICCHIFGLAGVFIGTFVSGCTLWLFSYPKYVYKGIFQRNYICYAKETLGYFVLFLIMASGTYYLSSFIQLENLYLNFISHVFVAVIVPNILLFIVFHKTNNFQYYLRLLRSFYKKLR